MTQSSGDTGSGDTGVQLGAHVTGNPIPTGGSIGGNVTVGHTIVIVLGALALLWLFGMGPLRSVRM